MWLLVEPLGMLAELPPGMIWIPHPPEQIFSEADRHLDMQGDLLEHAARHATVPERIPHMTDVERAAYVTRRVGSEGWSCFAVRTENLRYSVVVVHEPQADEADAALAPEPHSPQPA